ncbi:MAG: Obg family GTPase CgtA [Gammaproteobacteria bacterium]|tara:strand:+ start:6147 stop:7133 length:987 start_codon:yes stop_codon:yes gene_type:complete
MAFYDEARITVISGKGGDGCSSFRREKYIPRGGPDGGDGGKGGDVYIKLDKNLNSLISLKGKRQFSADKGKSGSGKNKKGESGLNQNIFVPDGTLIFSSQTKELIGEISSEKHEILVAKGGKGGLGNARFKSSTNQSPKNITKGEESEEREIYLELRLIADVGLLGLPNAGKSSLINSITNSKSKIGAYEFTTLDPSLGILENEHKKISIADLPGIIEGASDGLGLGVKFLKHAFRTKLLLHLVDSSHGLESAQRSYSIIENELKKFHLDFSNQSRWLVVSKIDLVKDEDLSVILNFFQKKYPGMPIFPISSKTKIGFDALSEKLLKI